MNILDKIEKLYSMRPALFLLTIIAICFISLLLMVLLSAVFGVGPTILAGASS